jgi:hypothetical protein
MSLPYSLIKNGVITIGQGINPQQGVDSNQYNALIQILKDGEQPNNTDISSRNYIKKIITTVSTIFQVCFCLSPNLNI